MGMSDGGNEGLFKLAEQAAPDPNRLMPTERKYAKTTKTLQLSDALALMKERKAQKAPVIPGGLDDPTASLKAPVQKEEKDPFEGFIGPTEETPAETSTPKKQKKISPQSISTILSTLAFLVKEVKALKEKLTKPEKEEETIDILARFKKEKHRVTFRLNEMEFTVTCLGLIKDASTHTLVLPFSTETEAFFTPPMRSELKLSYDGKRIDGKLFYFGMSFAVPELGMRFLGFLYDDTEIGG